jgi:hypothetical protein
VVSFSKGYSDTPLMFDPSLHLSRKNLPYISFVHFLSFKRLIIILIFLIDKAIFVITGDDEHTDVSDDEAYASEQQVSYICSGLPFLKSRGLLIYLGCV